MTTPIIVPMTVTVSGATIPMSVSSSTVTLGASLGVSYSMSESPPEYEGSYEITPRLSQQTLDTINKMMTSNLTVNQIPVVYTSNNYDGQTVVIG